MADGKRQEVIDVYGWVPEWRFDGNDLSGRRETWLRSNLHAQPRGLVDIVIGKQTFNVGESGDFQLTVTREKVDGLRYSNLSF
jgi:hypothetical protein